MQKRSVEVEMDSLVDLGILFFELITKNLCKTT